MYNTEQRPSIIPTHRYVIHSSVCLAMQTGYSILFHSILDHHIKNHLGVDVVSSAHKRLFEFLNQIQSRTYVPFELQIIASETNISGKLQLKLEHR